MEFTALGPLLSSHFLRREDRRSGTTSSAALDDREVGFDTAGGCVCEFLSALLLAALSGTDFLACASGSSSFTCRRVDRVAMTGAGGCKTYNGCSVDRVERRENL